MKRAVNIVLWSATTLTLAAAAFCLGLVFWEDSQKEQKFGRN